MVKAFMRLITHNLDPSKGLIRNQDTIGQQFYFGTFYHDQECWNDFIKWAKKEGYSYSIAHYSHLNYDNYDYYRIELSRREGGIVKTWLYQACLMYINVEKILSNKKNRPAAIRNKPVFQLNSYNGQITPIDPW